MWYSGGGDVHLSVKRDGPLGGITWTREGTLWLREGDRCTRFVARMDGEEGSIKPDVYCDFPKWDAPCTIDEAELSQHKVPQDEEWLAQVEIHSFDHSTNKRLGRGGQFSLNQHKSRERAARPQPVQNAAPAHAAVMAVSAVSPPSSAVAPLVEKTVASVATSSSSPPSAAAAPVATSSSSPPSTTKTVPPATRAVPTPSSSSPPPPPTRLSPPLAPASSSRDIQNSNNLPLRESGSGSLLLSIFDDGDDNEGPPFQRHSAPTTPALIPTPRSSSVPTHIEPELEFFEEQRNNGGRGGEPHDGWEDLDHAPHANGSEEEERNAGERGGNAPNREKRQQTTIGSSPPNEDLSPDDWPALRSPARDDATAPREEATRLCTGCHRYLGRFSYSNAQWRKPSGQGARCKKCAQK